jgi:hypothetical protein
MRLAEISTWPTVTPKIYPPSLFDTESEGFGDEAIALAKRFLDAAIHYRFPVTRQTTFDKFQSLVSEWKENTRFMSSSTAMILDTAYQEIVGMGPSVIPFILRELETRPDYWFPALKALTGVDPVPSSERGKIRAMAKAWLDWARDQGYTW